MAKKQRLGLFRQMFNVSGWMGMSNLTQSASDIVKSFKDLSLTREAARRETFDEAMQRLGMKEADVLLRIRQCYYTAWFYVACSLLLFAYAIYLITLHIFLGAIITLILTLLAGALAYRESFWYFQMKVRKLGCTFKEYQAFMLGRKK